MNKINFDEYMLTQGQALFLAGYHDEQTSFEIFVRSLPGKDAPDERTARTYLVASGLSEALEHLQHLKVSDQHCEWLAADGYDPEFIEFLRTWSFKGSVHAVPEGTVITNQVPMATFSGSRFDCQMIETAMLGIFGPNTLFATKAARVVQAAQGRQLSDFSLRRLQGSAVAATVARSAFIAGFASSASWEYAHELGIPTAGTMAHHFVMRFGPDREQEAFELFLRSWPDRSVLLIDTYDTLRGARRAMAASKATGIALKAVRLDSGDLLELSKGVRQILDDGGFESTHIIATNDLHEIAIDDLLSAGAPIDAFGVGTMLGTSADAPALGIVYKLTEQTIDGETTRCMKLAAGKQTDPGTHTVWRSRSDRQLTLALDHEDLSETHDQLTQLVMQDGVAVQTPVSLHDVRSLVEQELAQMPATARFGKRARPLTLDRTQELWKLRESLGDPEAHLHIA